MGIACPADLDTTKLRQEVQAIYARLAIDPGVVNLAPDKRRAFSEVLRILKPGAQFLFGDIVVTQERSASIQRVPASSSRAGVKRGCGRSMCTFVVEKGETDVAA